MPAVAAPPALISRELHGHNCGRDNRWFHWVGEWSCSFDETSRRQYMMVRSPQSPASVVLEPYCGIRWRGVHLPNVDWWVVAWHVEVGRLGFEVDPDAEGIEKEYLVLWWRTEPATTTNQGSHVDHHQEKCERITHWPWVGLVGLSENRRWVLHGWPSNQDNRKKFLCNWE